MKQRVITGTLAATAFIVFLIMGGYWFFALILIMAFVGYLEFVRLIGREPKDVSTAVGLMYVLYLVMPRNLFPGMSLLSPQGALWLFLLLLLILTVASKNRIHIRHVSVLFLGAVYIGAGFSSMVWIRWEHGLFWSLLIFISIWMTDTGAYLSGRWFGKHKLWPAISPKKTVEGAVGGLVFAIFATGLFSFFAPGAISWNKALLAGVMIAVLSQIGDLVQSAYKRFAGVKDSGHLLPGHGGVLDRCDSWLLVFPFIAYFLL